MINFNKMEQILSLCCKEDLVKTAVIKNHDNNLWWPIEIMDGRKRLLIAGLSTRISYNMITTYRRVIFQFDKYCYEEIKDMNDEELSIIVAPLGLINTRLTYLKSMINFIDEYYDKLSLYNNDQLIQLISDHVQGASYKVAQCCVLYLRGYYCGIMPVDSGMKDVLLPCIGFSKYNGSIAHEKLRKELEEIVCNIDIKTIILENGYDEFITVPTDAHSMTWWAHLVLIYFKRYFCNKHKPEQCPICQIYNLPCLCNKTQEES